MESFQWTELMSSGVPDSDLLVLHLIKATISDKSFIQNKYQCFIFFYLREIERERVHLLNASELGFSFVIYNIKKVTSTKSVHLY